MVSMEKIVLKSVLVHVQVVTTLTVSVTGDVTQVGRDTLVMNVSFYLLHINSVPGNAYIVIMLTFTIDRIPFMFN